jgi:hypothetical protein
VAGWRRDERGEGKRRFWEKERENVTVTKIMTFAAINSKIDLLTSDVVRIFIKKISATNIH